MKIEKKYQITKILLVLLSIVFIIVLFVIGKYQSDKKFEEKQAEIIRGTYINKRLFLNFALDDEKMMYYVSGDIISNGKYKKMSDNVFKLSSGKLKDSYVIKDTNGDITIISYNLNAEVEGMLAERFVKEGNTVLQVTP